MSNIIRVSKRKKFTIIDRALLEDQRLMWSTRGVLAYLLCKQDDWVLRIEDLRKQGDLGRDAIYKRINDAIEYGYITRLKIRDELGRIVRTEYIVHEESQIPFPEKPDMDKPDHDIQYTDNQTHNKDLNILNTDTTTTTEDEGGCSYIFHKELSHVQKHEIIKLLFPLSQDTAQDILFELSGYIDKKLVKKDEVSLVQGFVRKAQQGEFCLRLGIRYKESSIKSTRMEKALSKALEQSPELRPVDETNGLVKKLNNMQKKYQNKNSKSIKTS